MDWWRGGWWSEWWDALVDRLRGRSLAPPPTAVGGYWPTLESGAHYAALYRTQPHVRTVIDFLSQQIAQLGIHVFRRVSDTDRVRVANHPLARLLRTPNPGTTRYQWMVETVADWCVYGNAYSVKLRRRNRLELYRVPAPNMRPVGDLIPRAYVWTLPNGDTLTLPAEDVFHLRDYNPDDPVIGLSRLETLRKILAEDTAATTFREWFWTNGAKLAGWIKRPKEAPRWTTEQREQFRNEWSQFQGPRNSGKTAVLEDGMEFYPITATARDSELIAARKLTREEVAAAFHVQPAMIGILEAQGYGSLREQHRALYQDTLGPHVAMLEAEIERQLLSEFSDSDDTYIQFNINEKLQGSFEEEQAALSGAVGSPWMSRNEARARMNLPRINDTTFDKPVTRLDIAEGQQTKAVKPSDAPAATAPVVWLESAPTAAAVDLAPLADRLERALRVLPAELAARLPAPSALALTRPIRDEAGRIAGFEDIDALGNVIARRDVVRGADGRVVEIAPAEVA
jgi:HK97 family phage portal protein